MLESFGFMLRFHAAFTAVAACLLGPCLHPATRTSVLPPWYSSGMAVLLLVVGWGLAFGWCTANPSTSTSTSTSTGTGTSGTGTTADDVSKTVPTPHARHEQHLHQAWRFAQTLSVFQVVPDLFLNAVYERACVRASIHPCIATRQHRCKLVSHRNLNDGGVVAELWKARQSLTKPESFV